MASSSSSSARASECGGRGGIPWSLPDRVPRVTGVRAMATELDVVPLPGIPSAFLHRALLPDRAPRVSITHLGPMATEADVLLDGPSAVSSVSLHRAPLPDDAAWDKKKDDVCPILPPPPPLHAPVSSGELPPRLIFGRAPTPSLPARMEREDGAQAATAATATVAGVGGGKRAQRSALNRKLLREALIAEALNDLPKPREAKILAAGGDEYDPYLLDLFVFRRAVPPWDVAWESRPLVLHDGRLADVVVAHTSDQAQPRDHVEALTAILGHHPGPISSFRLNSSMCPDADTLASWVDALTDKGVEELVVYNLYADVATVRFPLRRLNSDLLTTLAIGFVDVTAEITDGGWCCASLTTLSLTECRFRVADLSKTVRLLECLTSLTIGWCNLLGCRPGTQTLDPAEGLTVESTSLRSLRFWKCTATALTILYAPKLRFLEVDITSRVPGAADSSSNSNVSILLQEAGALQELKAVTLPLHIIEIHGDLGPHFKRKRRESLHYLTTLDLTIHMCVPGQATAFVELLSLLPVLSDLIIMRGDSTLSGGEEDDEKLAHSWSLPCVPVCIKESLTNIVFKGYRAGPEHALIQGLLKSARKLLSVTLHVHPTMWALLLLPEEATTSLKNSPRASKKCKITVAEVPTAPSPLESLLSELNLV